MRMGLKIKTLRMAQKLTLEELANLTYSTKSYIWGLENNEKRHPTAYKLFKVAQALDVTMEYLVDEKARLEDAIKKRAFFRKFNHLSPEVQKKVEQIIGLWKD